jgi:DNA-binding protein HU-beta
MPNAQQPITKMNKAELIEAAAAKTQTTQKQTNTLLNALLESIIEAVTAGDKVTIVGFGTFDARDRKAREGRHPKTGETMTIPAATVPYFSPGKDFRETVNK